MLSMQMNCVPLTQQFASAEVGTFLLTGIPQRNGWVGCVGGENGKGTKVSQSIIRQLHIYGVHVTNKICGPYLIVKGSSN